MVQIVWTKRAVFDLEEIVDYISKDSIKYARHQILKSGKLPKFSKPNH